MDSKSSPTAFEAAWNPDCEPIAFADPWGKVGAYTTMLVDGSPPRPLFQDRHMDRLSQSLEHLGMANPYGGTFLEDSVAHAAANLGATPCMLRVAIVGEGLFLSSYPQTGKGAELRGRPCHARRRLPAAKSLLDVGLHQELAQVDRGTEELLLVSPQGHVLEGATTNLLLVRGDAVLAPMREALPGITRQVIEEHLPAQWNWESAEVRLEELPTMDEILLCGSGKEVARITHLEGIEWAPASARAFDSIAQAYEAAKQLYLANHPGKDPQG